jgi:branched-chain amino acid transport system permease protein
MAGSLYAPFLSVVTPTSFGFTESVVILAMLIFGGLGTIRGAVVGALILGSLPEAFRFISNYRLLTFGVVLLLMLRFQPEGLLGDGSVLVKLTRRSVGALRQRRRSGTPDPPGAAV